MEQFFVFLSYMTEIVIVRSLFYKIYVSRGRPSVTP